MGHSYINTPRDSEDLMREVILLAACSAGEVLPQTPDLPADVFTACLTTPIKARFPQGYGSQIWLLHALACSAFATLNTLLRLCMDGMDDSRS